MDASLIALLTGSAGVFGSLAGVWMTQRRSDLRDRLRLSSEEHRERHRLELEVDREDAARLFEHRRDAYLAVIASYHRLMTPLWLRDDYMSEKEYDAEVRVLWSAVAAVDIFGAAETSRLLRDLFERLFDLFNKGGDSEAMEADVEAAFKAFIAVARNDLGVDRARVNEKLPAVRLSSQGSGNPARLPERGKPA